MKKTNFKKQVAAIMLTLILAIILPQTSKAGVLQANPTTNTSTYASQKTGYAWISAIRDMEKNGQAMGLTETIDSATKLWTTDSKSNDIDVHMMKSTEYGAMAILSASGFGNPSNDKIVTTTTGNNSGVYMQTSRVELVAGLGENASYINESTSISHRYFNTYKDVSNFAKPGDALNLKWHGASQSTGYNGLGKRIFTRGAGNGIFGYGADEGVNDTNNSKYFCRAVVVSGIGF